MKTLVLAALSLALALPASAASAPKKAKQKARTLDSIIKLAMSEGRAGKLGPTSMRELEVGGDLATNGQVPTMLIQYEQAVCPDDQKHAFEVAYRDGDNKTPLFLVLSVYRGRREGESILADGYSMRVNLDGKLEKIVSIKGVVRHATHTILDPNSTESKNALQHEMHFYTKDSLTLERTKP